MLYVVKWKDPVGDFWQKTVPLDIATALREIAQLNIQVPDMEIRLVPYKEKTNG